MSIRLAQARALHYSRGLVWLRRDLRAHDHAALYHALKSCDQVFVAFALDSAILETLPRSDRRVEFILASLRDVDSALRSMAQAVQIPNAEQVQLIVRHGQATQELPKLAAALGVQAVFCNREYEPAAISRDKLVRGALAQAGIMLHHFKDQVLFERGELLTPQGKAPTGFAAYERAWRLGLQPDALKPYPCASLAQHLASVPTALQQPLPQLHDIDFLPSNLAALKIPTGSSGAAQMLDYFLPHLDSYLERADYPARRGVSYLGIHLRFGSLSIRQAVAPAWALAQQGHAGAAAWLGGLVRHDFYAQLLALRPDLAKGKSYKREFEHIAWEKGARTKKIFAAWCSGNTGYPLIDAAMRQLNYSGYMHPRLRLMSASFFCKHLGLDWRRGAAYFAEKLSDYDLASNNGGWQWAAGSGSDAQPSFRIFNPVQQSQKYDPDGRFIRRYVPELAQLDLPHLHAPWLADALELQACGLRLGNKAGDHYPLPIVDQHEAVAKTKLRYAVIKEKP